MKRCASPAIRAFWRRCPRTCASRFWIRRIVQLARGETLFHQGDAASAIHIVADGWVKLCRIAADSRGRCRRDDEGPELRRHRLAPRRLSGVRDGMQLPAHRVARGRQLSIVRAPPRPRSRFSRRPSCTCRGSSVDRAVEGPFGDAAGSGVSAANMPGGSRQRQRERFLTTRSSSPAVSA